MIYNHNQDIDTFLQSESLNFRDLGLLSLANNKVIISYITKLKSLTNLDFYHPNFNTIYGIC